MWLSDMYIDGIHEDSKFSTVHECWYTESWKLMDIIPIIFLSKNDDSKNNQFGRFTLDTYIALHPREGTPICITFSIFFPYFYTYMNGLLSKPGVGCQGTNWLHYFFCSSFFLLFFFLLLFLKKISILII